MRPVNISQVYVDISDNIKLMYVVTTDNQQDTAQASYGYATYGTAVYSEPTEN